MEEEKAPVRYTMTFTGEEKSEFDIAYRGGDMACCLTDIRNMLRTHYKYGIEPQFGGPEGTKEEYITKIYEGVCDLISSYNLGDVV